MAKKGAVSVSVDSSAGFQAEPYRRSQSGLSQVSVTCKNPSPGISLAVVDPGGRLHVPVHGAQLAHHGGGAAVAAVPLHDAEAALQAHDEPVRGALYRHDEPHAASCGTRNDA